MADIGVVMVAAGRGLRAGGDRPKQYVEIGGESVLRKSLRAFLDHPAVGWVQPVIHVEDGDMFARATQGLGFLPPVAGGATRQDSVRAGLEALAGHAPAVVLIHDAARPIVSADVITRVADAARRHGAALPVLPLADTVKTVDAAQNVTGTIDRNTLRLAQTPQAFLFAPILDAHRRAAREGRADFTDDAALAEWNGMTVSTVLGDAANIKITTPDDIARAQQRRGAMNEEIRSATGYDVHAFGPGDAVIIGGVSIPHRKGLSGHSDADVALHSLVDAVLGAIADGDIGAHFPPSDPQWRGASSDRFLAFAIERVKAKGGRIVHLDVTIVCEAPKIGPHRDAIRARIAEIAGIGINRVSVKATTSERLGFTGREEGIAALATASVALPAVVD